MSRFYFLYFEQDYWKKQARSDIVTAEQIMAAKIPTRNTKTESHAGM